MTALVSENTIDARPARSRCECAENQTELYLSVDKLKKKKKKGRNDVTGKTEDTCTPARLEALFKSSQSSPSVSFVPSRIRSPSFLASDCVRNPSRCFVKTSAVLFFVSTRLTHKRFSRIHCCIAMHRISICLSPPGPCAVECVLPNLSPSRDELKRCSKVP